MTTEQPPSAAARSQPRGDHPDTTTWSLWPVLTWLLPLLWFWLALGAGWMYIGYIFVIVLYPLVGIAGMRPRIILRRRGATGTPHQIVPFLVVHWWAIILPVAITLAQYLLGSVFESVFGVREIAVGTRMTILSVSTGVALVSWVVVMALTSTSGSSPGRARFWIRISRVVSIGAPVFVVAILLGALFSTGQQRDGAGTTVADAHRQTLAQQAEQFASRYEQMNRTVSQVRELIADDAWSEHLTGPGDDRACSGAAAACYTFEANFVHPIAGEDVDAASLRSALESEGWVVGELRNYAGRDAGLTATGDDGLVVEIHHLDGAAEIRVTATTDFWWGDERALRDELGDDGGLDTVRTYRFDEWPPLV